MRIRNLAAVSLLALAASALPALAQTPAPAAPTLSYPDEFVTVGGGHDQDSGGFAFVALAKKTSMTNGTNNFPVYSYNELLEYRQPTGKLAATATTGLLFPFYDGLGVPLPGLTTRVLTKLRFTAAIGGTAGVGSTGSNVGFTYGANAFVRISTATSRIGVELGGNPTRGTGGLGVHASRYSVGATYSFK